MNYEKTDIRDSMPPWEESTSEGQLECGRRCGAASSCAIATGTVLQCRVRAVPVWHSHLGAVAQRCGVTVDDNGANDLRRSEPLFPERAMFASVENECNRPRCKSL